MEVNSHAFLSKVIVLLTYGLYNHHAHSVYHCLGHDPHDPCRFSDQDSALELEFLDASSLTWLKEVVDNVVD